MTTTIGYVPTSHLDLFWLGDYKTCLERGAFVIKQYLDRCLETEDETFLLETTVFADYFLRKHPEYREHLVRLVQEQRVEVGTAYVDRWENLILGESQIRNIQFGKRWCKEVLGIDNRLTTHPDLPGLAPQTAQLYAQAGVDFYVTSRKLFPSGAVWQHRAPDGSSLLMLNYPRHYIYTEIALEDAPPEPEDWWRKKVGLRQALEGFPLGTILIAGSAADLTDRETFRERYGDYLEGLIAENRRSHPDLNFVYTIPSKVLQPYLDYDKLPVYEGEVPSVWGVAADEEVAFFRRDRALESLLLTTETLAAVADSLKLAWLPASSPNWQGVFYESAFYAAKDPIQAGEELAELWRMHVFTQDHNGGGYEGSLSSFQKRVMQQRCFDYAEEIVQTTLSNLAQQLAGSGSVALAFNPDGRAWSGALKAAMPKERWEAGERLTGASGAALPAQYDQEAGDQVSFYTLVKDIPAVGYQTFPVVPADLSVQAVENPCSVTTDGNTTVISNALVALSLDRISGAVTAIADRQRGCTWRGHNIGQLAAYVESGSDVTLRLDESTPPALEVLERIEEPEVGPLFARIRIHKRLLDAAVVQTITVWNHSSRVDLQTQIRWWGAHNWQLRQALPSAAGIDDIAYGTPFYGSAWSSYVPGSAPRNPDEILVADYHHYREVQNWLHLRQSDGGLTIATLHPGFYYDDAHGLQAVLMRTSPSCGDHRLFWENAGEQTYTFTLLTGDADWQQADAQRLAMHIHRPPIVQITSRAGNGSLPDSQSLLRLEGESVQLSALYPAGAQAGIVVRLVETAGKTDTVTLQGPMAAENKASATNLLEEDPHSLTKEADGWSLSLAPWRIQTVLLTPEEA